MKKNFIFLLILSLTSLISCYRPDHYPSIFREAERLMPQHPDSALALLEQVKRTESLSRGDKAHYFLLLTEAQNKNHIPHTSDSLIGIATDYYENTADVSQKAKAWYYKGRISQDLGHPLKAQEYYLKALRDEEEIEDHALLGRIHNNIGMLYTYQTVYDKALPFQKKAVQDFRVLKDSVGEVFALRDLGRTFLMLGHQDSAIVCNQKAIALMGEQIVPSVYTELADLYVATQQIGEAYELLHIALRNTAKPQVKYPTYLVLGELLLQCGQIDSARFYLQACADSAPLPKTRAGGLFSLKEIASAQKQWELAVSLSNRYESLRDSIEKEQQAESIRNVQAFYSYNDIERDLWEVRLYASKQKSFYSLAITVCLFLLSGAILYLIHYRRERKNVLQRLKENEAQILKDEQTIKEISDVKEDLQNDIQHYQIKEQELIKEKEILSKEKKKSLAEKDEQLKRTSEQIEQKSILLEKLSHAKKELEQSLTILQTENSNLKKREQARREEQKKIEESEQLKNELLYNKFRSPAGWKPTDTDWHKLFISMDKLYPNMATTLQESTSLNESEKKICYLTKIGVKPGVIETLLCKGNASVCRKRLYEKLTKRQGTAKDLYRYIYSIQLFI